MRGRIKVAAEANNRSMNAEIVDCLEARFPAPDIDLEAELEELLQSIRSDDAANLEVREEIFDRLTHIKRTLFKRQYEEPPKKVTWPPPTPDE